MRSMHLLAATAVAVALGCSGDDGPTEQGDTGDNGGNFTVTVSDNVFNPSTLSVPVNSTVTWQWSSATLVHNVRFQDGPASMDQTTGTFARTFDAAGTYSYLCSFHAAEGMTGTITVTAGTGGGGDTGGDDGGGGYP
jgi:plastocyanin